MGQVTPNISIYIPSAGETNFDQSFALGMVNIDNHNHSGGPTGGVPIPTAGIEDGSITAAKLNASFYDTGTFTPALSFGGSSVGITYSNQTGKFWKIGAMVFFSVDIVLTSKGAQVGTARVDLSGIGLTPSSTSFTHGTMQGSINTYPAGTTFILGEIVPSSTAMVLAAVGAGNNTALTNTNFGNTDNFTLSGFFWTA